MCRPEIALGLAAWFLWDNRETVVQRMQFLVGSAAPVEAQLVAPSAAISAEPGEEVPSAGLVAASPQVGRELAYSCLGQVPLVDFVAVVAESEEAVHSAGSSVEWRPAVLESACSLPGLVLLADAAVTMRLAEHHFPCSWPVPGPPADTAVEASFLAVTKTACCWLAFDYRTILPADTASSSPSSMPVACNTAAGA